MLAENQIIMNPASQSAFKPAPYVGVGLSYSLISW